MQLIQNRHTSLLAQGQMSLRVKVLLPGHDGNSNIVYNEAGTVFCYDKVSEPPVKHKMAYTGSLLSG